MLGALGLYFARQRPPCRTILDLKDADYVQGICGDLELDSLLGLAFPAPGARRGLPGVLSSLLDGPFGNLHGDIRLYQDEMPVGEPQSSIRVLHGSFTPSVSMPPARSLNVIRSEPVVHWISRLYTPDLHRGVDR